MRNEWLIFPSVMQKQVLDEIHTGHQGIGKCLESARQAAWWPGLSAELESVVSKCRSCCMNQVDLFEWKKIVYLIIVDYYSRFS